MAKQLKAIKCPQCGSTDKTEIKPDFFRCNSCNTEYFLDNDDVNVNYNHNYTNRPDFQTNSKNQYKIFYYILAGFIILGALINLFSPGSKSKSISHSTYESPATKEKEFRASRYLGFPFIQPGTDKTFVIYAEDRDYSDNTDEKKDGIYMTIYTPELNERISEQKIGDDKLSGSDLKIRKFDNGKIYLIVNKATLYILDQQDLKFKDAGKDVFGAEPNLQPGVATVDFTYNDDGDGLIILTNDGKNFTYFPAVKKLYTKAQLSKAVEGFNTLLPDAKERVYFTFTSSSSEYPEEKRQLLKVIYKDNPGGPKDMMMNPSWSRDYGGSGIFTGNDPYRKVLFSPYMRERGRILNWKDLTPDRLYFDPSVLFYDEQNLIIQFKNNAAPNAPKSIQKLNINTGAVEWTFSIDKSYVNQVLATKNGFIVTKSSDETTLLSKEGKLTGTYKFE